MVRLVVNKKSLLGGSPCSVIQNNIYNRLSPGLNSNPEKSHHSHRRKNVVGHEEPPVDELILFIVEGVAIVYVNLALSSILLHKRQNVKCDTVNL